jgi:AcrR family transcriptional regulator
MPQAKKKVAAVKKVKKAVAPQAQIRAVRTAAAAADVRGALLKASLEVLAEEGLEAATVKRIAAVAGVNHGLVHYYFGSKEAMLLEAFNTDQRREIDRLRERFGTSSSEKPLTEFWSLMGKVLKDPKRVKISAQLTALSMYNPELTGDINQSNQKLSSELGKVLSAQLGRTPRPSDAIAARLLMGGLITLSLWALRENPKELDEAFEMLTRMISGELHRK